MLSSAQVLVDILLSVSEVSRTSAVTAGLSGCCTCTERTIGENVRMWQDIVRCSQAVGTAEMVVAAVEDYSEWRALGGKRESDTSGCWTRCGCAMWMNIQKMWYEEVPRVALLRNYSMESTLPSPRMVGVEDDRRRVRLHYRD